jgi:hypothetical protein
MITTPFDLPADLTGSGLDPAQVTALIDRLSKIQSTAGSLLSNATQAKKLLAQMTTPPAQNS